MEVLEEQNTLNCIREFQDDKMCINKKVRVYVNPHFFYLHFLG